MQAHLAGKPATVSAAVKISIPREIDQLPSRARAAEIQTRNRGEFLGILQQGYVAVGFVVNETESHYLMGKLYEH